MVSVNCTAGQQPNSDNTACILCPEGTYKRGTGGSDCTKCSKNRTTVEDGATDGTQCQSKKTISITLCIIVSISVHWFCINHASIKIAYSDRLDNDDI